MPGPLQQLGSRVAESIRDYGLFRTVLTCAKQPFTPVLRNPYFSRRISTFLRAYADRRFDRKFGVDTSGRINLDELEGNSQHYAQGNPYEGIEPAYFHRMMQTLPFDFSRYVFIDYGSGKGRGLLLASDYAFRRILGVEWSAPLHKTAERNIRLYRSPRQKCTTIESICADATTYRPPAEPCFLFFNNPFEAPLVARVVANLEASLRESPREMVVLYCRPAADHVFLGSQSFEKVKSKSWFSVYRSKVVRPADRLTAGKVH